MLGDPYPELYLSFAENDTLATSAIGPIPGGLLVPIILLPAQEQEVQLVREQSHLAEVSGQGH